MANIKSAKKRIAIIARNTARNRKIKEAIRALIKEIGKTHAKQENVAEVLKKTLKYIDSAVSKGVWHWKTAARQKSRLIARFKTPVPKA